VGGHGSEGRFTRASGFLEQGDFRHGMVSARYPFDLDSIATAPGLSPGAGCRPHPKARYNPC
jgi:hypothetical protein